MPLVSLGVPLLLVFLEALEALQIPVHQWFQLGLGPQGLPTLLPDLWRLANPDYLVSLMVQPLPGAQRVHLDQLPLMGRQLQVHPLPLIGLCYQVSQRAQPALVFLSVLQRLVHLGLQRVQ